MANTIKALVNRLDSACSDLRANIGDVESSVEDIELLAAELQQEGDTIANYEELHRLIGEVVALYNKLSPL